MTNSEWRKALKFNREPVKLSSSNDALSKEYLNRVYDLDIAKKCV